MSKRRTNKLKHQARVQPPARSRQLLGDDKQMEVAGMTVTWQPLEDPEIDRLPADVSDSMTELHDGMFSDPAATLPLLRAMSAAYPKVLCLRNWISVCHRFLGDHEKAAQESEATFRDHPDYLFARMGAVEVMLGRGDLDLAEATLFAKGRTLLEIYPGRTVFHITEVRSWFTVCGRLFVIQQKMDEAWDCRDWLAELEPGSEAVEMMDRLLAAETLAALEMLDKLRKGFQKLTTVPRKRRPLPVANGGKKKLTPPAADDTPELF